MTDEEKIEKEAALREHFDVPSPEVIPEYAIKHVDLEPVVATEEAIDWGHKVADDVVRSQKRRQEIVDWVKRRNRLIEESKKNK